MIEDCKACEEIRQIEAIFKRGNAVVIPDWMSWHIRHLVDFHCVCERKGGYKK